MLQPRLITWSSVVVLVVVDLVVVVLVAIEPTIHSQLVQALQ
jgi:hypothetical protein